MTRRLLIFALAFVLLLTGCTASGQFSYLSSPKAGILSDAVPDAAYPAPQEVLDALTAAELAGQVYANGITEAAVREAADDGCTLLIVLLGSADEADAVLAAARPLRLPVVFYGVQPSAQLIGSYDKAWYIGGKPDKQGELLGEALVADYRAGVIVDKNADHLLQTVTINLTQETDVRAEATLRVFENYGIFSQQLDTLTAGSADSAAGYELTRALLNESGDTVELLLCATPTLAQGAAQAVAEAGLTVPIGCYGDSALLNDALAEGRVLAVSAPDENALMDLLSAFACNIAQNKSPLDNTSARLDSNGSVWIDFYLRPEAQTTTGETND